MINFLYLVTFSWSWFSNQKFIALAYTLFIVLGPINMSQKINWVFLYITIRTSYGRDCVLLLLPRPGRYPMTWGPYLETKNGATNLTYPCYPRKGAPTSLELAITTPEPEHCLTNKNTQSICFWISFIIMFVCPSIWICSKCLLLCWKSGAVNIGFHWY